MKKHIPDLITLANLFFGCCAIICVLYAAPMSAFWFLVAAFVADGLDGQVARILNTSSKLGKELDSIADTVSFAVAPGMIIYVLLCKSFAMSGDWARYTQDGTGVVLPALAAFIVSAAGGYRLAKYNVDTRQSDKFIGVPTPANTIFVAGLLLIYTHNPILFGVELGDKLLNPYLLFSLIPVLAYWQIAEIPLMNFRVNGFGLVENKFRYLYLVLVLLSFILLKEVAVSLITVLYVLVSILENALVEKIEAV
ncbi:MAG: CDP-alcohol phosphatidyltransferase family protein [Saprospiraceae bacterium]